MRILPIPAIALSLGLTVLAWRVMSSHAHQKAQELLTGRAAEMVRQIEAHVRADEQILLGARGLFLAGDRVTRDAWRRYVEALQLGQNYSGIQGVGFSQWIPAAEKEAHIQAVRAEGFPRYTIRPDGERSDYTSIVFIEPFDWRNQRAFGYDMYSEKVRSVAMARAWREGLTSLSGRVVLVQETEQQTQNGVLMYLPVYRRTLPIDSVEQRRAALLGFVYSPIRIGNLVSSTILQRPEDIGFRITVDPSGETLFESHEVAGEPGEDGPMAVFSYREQLELYGQTWSFDFHARPAFAANLDLSKAKQALGGGLLLTLLLVLLIQQLRTTRLRAKVLAGEMVGRLEVSEQKYRQLVESAPDMVYTFSTRRGGVYYSPQVASTFGRSAEHLVQHPFAWTNAIHPDDRPMVDQVLSEVAPGNGFELEYRIQKSDGQCRWLRDRSFRIQRLGDETLVDGIANDITDLKQAQEALRESERFARATLDALSAHVCVVDDRGVILAVNQAWRDFADAGSADESRTMEGANYWAVCEAVTGPDRPVAIAFMLGAQAVLRGEQESYALEYPCHSPKERRWYSVSVTRFLSAGPGRIVVTHENTTVRREAEIVLQQVKERLQLATQAANIGIWDWEVESDVLTWDDAMYRIYGISPVDFENAYEAWARCIHPSDMAKASDGIQKALRGEKEYAIDFRILWPDGSVRVIHAESRTLRDRDGKPLRMVGVNFDITAQKQAEVDRLVLGKLESTGILAGGIAHDFNNLLTVIMIGLDFIRQNAVETADTLAILSEAEEATRSARKLAVQLIALSDGGEPVRRPMRIEELLNRTVKGALDGSSILAHVKTPSGLWMAEIDEAQIGHVFRNLIMNAREAMDAGGRVKIDVSNVVLSPESEPSLPAGDFLCVRVEDEGVGIAPEFLPKVFDPYYSTKERGSQKGMGLGLTICHAVLKKHGGAITAESTPGHGSRFSVYLPAVRLSAGA